MEGLSTRTLNNPSKQTEEEAVMAHHNVSSLNDLYIHELHDIYSAEKQIINALPKMAEATSNTELKNAFMEHMEASKNHCSRLDRIFESIDEKPDNKTCEGMQGIISEGEDMLSMDTDPDLKDAALISSAQRVEHYEMAVYGTLRNWAQRLGREEDAELLQQNLNEEGETDHYLTELARNINPKAAQH